MRVALATLLVASSACGRGEHGASVPSTASTREPGADRRDAAPGPPAEAPPDPALRAAALRAEECARGRRAGPRSTGDDDRATCDADAASAAARATEVGLARATDTYLDLLSRGDPLSMTAAFRCIAPFATRAVASSKADMPAGAALLRMRGLLGAASGACADARIAERTLRVYERWIDEAPGPDEGAAMALEPVLACGPLDPQRSARVLRVARSFPVPEIRKTLVLDLAGSHPTSRPVQEHLVSLLRGDGDPFERCAAVYGLSLMRAGDDAAGCSAAVDAVGRASSPTSALAECAEPSFTPDARCASHVDAFVAAAPDHVPGAAILASVATLCRESRLSETARKNVLQLAPALEASPVPAERTSGRNVRCACAPPSQRVGCRK